MTGMNARVESDVVYGSVTYGHCYVCSVCSRVSLSAAQNSNDLEALKRALPWVCEEGWATACNCPQHCKLMTLEAAQRLRAPAPGAERWA